LSPGLVKNTKTLFSFDRKDCSKYNSSQFTSLTIGMMELWSNGMMGLKEFFTIKMVYFRLTPNIPTFHSSILMA